MNNLVDFIFWLFMTAYCVVTSFRYGLAQKKNKQLIEENKQLKKRLELKLSTGSIAIAVIEAQSGLHR